MPPLLGVGGLLGTSTILCASCGERIEQVPICPLCQCSTILNDNYELIEEVGSGSFGTTFKARRISDGQILAVKEMLVSKADSAKTLELFEREAAVLERLEHPGIPKYHEDFVVGFGRHTALYLVQDFVTGRTLNEVFDGPTLPRQVFEACLNVLEILSYLHSFSPPVIHRDIKPQNIIQGDDGQLTLIDFGSVKAAMDRKEGGSTVAGTFGYMAPEQFMGRAVPQSDVYAVGALCVKLLTGQEPESFLKQDGFDFESMTVSADAERVLRRLLEYEGIRRPDTREAVALIDGLLRGGDYQTALVLAPPTSVKVPESFESYSRLLSQPGPRQIPSWMVQTHVPPYQDEVILGWLALLPMILVTGIMKIWWLAGIGVFFSAVLFSMSWLEKRTKQRFLQNGVLTQAVVTQSEIYSGRYSLTLSIRYRYEVGGTIYDGTSVRAIPTNRDPGSVAPKGTIPVLYLPDQPSKSLLLFAFPWKRYSDPAPMRLRFTRDNELIGVYPIAGQMTVGSLEDNTIMLPYPEVEPHHFFLSPTYGQIGAISEDIRVNDTQLYQKREIKIGDMIEFGGIRAEVEAVGERGDNEQ